MQEENTETKSNDDEYHGLYLKLAVTARFFQHLVEGLKLSIVISLVTILDKYLRDFIIFVSSRLFAIVNGLSLLNYN